MKPLDSYEAHYHDGASIRMLELICPYTQNYFSLYFATA